MSKKKFFYFPISIFFLIIYAVPILWLSRDNRTPEISLIEGRTLTDFPELSYRDFKTSIKRVIHGKVAEAEEIFFKQFTNREFQSQFEQAATDQFPFRLNGISLAKALDRKIIELAFLPLKDVAIPTDFKSGLYVLKDSQAIIYPPLGFDQSMKSRIDLRISNYDKLINEFPDLNFYLFYLQRLSESEYHPLNKYYPNSDLGQSLAYFEESKPVDLVMSKFMLNSLEDHLKYFYHTDHHWNIHGALTGYEIIYKMLAQNYPDISAPWPHEEIYTFPDIEYLGSLARKSYYNIKGEKFEVLNTELPPFKIMKKGEAFEYNKSAEYLAGNYSIEPYVNHYQTYFGKQTDLIDYVSDNQKERNLLIIGSSFTRPLQPLLAAHYHHTYVVDLRKYVDFSLSKFIEEYPVDDVLFIGDYRVAFQSMEWSITP